MRRLASRRAQQAIQRIIRIQPIERIQGRVAELKIVHCYSSGML